MKEPDANDPVDKILGYYDTKSIYSEVKSKLSKTLPEDVTKKNGFDSLTISIAETISIQDTLETLPNKAIYKIIDDIENDESLNYSFTQYYIDWQERSKITSLAKLKEWDATHPRFNYGNVTLEQYKLLKQYESLKSDNERKSFIEAHPELLINPREQYLTEHPEENAKLAIFGQSRIYTLEAYDIAKKLIKELDIPESALEGVIPPENIIKAYIEYQEMVAQYGASSNKAKDVRRRNPDFDKWGQENFGWKPISSTTSDSTIEISTTEELKETFESMFQ
jgi:hypothetical protein